MITKEHMLPKAGLDYFTETVNKIEAEKELLKRNIWRVLLTVHVLKLKMELCSKLDMQK